MIVLDGPPPDCPTWVCHYADCRYWLDGREAASWDRKGACLSKESLERGLKGWPSSFPSCALAVARRGPQTLESVGRLLNVTRERVRQIEATALARLLAAALNEPPLFVALAELINADPVRLYDRINAEMKEAHPDGWLAHWEQPRSPAGRQARSKMEVQLATVQQERRTELKELAC